MIGKNLDMGIAAAAILVLASLSSRAEDEDNSARLAKALPQASVDAAASARATHRDIMV
jgi:hypothetical protein